MSWSTLSDETRDDVAVQRPGQLTDLIDLGLLAKQVHWTVVGENFRSFHLQLDELVTSYRLWSDQAAERMVTVGAPPDHDLQRRRRPHPRRGPDGRRCWPRRSLYEVADRWHHHFVCRSCGQVIDVPCGRGSKPCSTPDLPGVELDEASIIFRSRCATCVVADIADRP